MPRIFSKITILSTILVGGAVAGSAFLFSTPSCASNRFKCCRDVPRCDVGFERQTKKTQYGDKLWRKCKTKCSCNFVGIPEREKDNGREREKPRK